MVAVNSSLLLNSIVPNPEIAFKQAYKVIKNTNKTDSLTVEAELRSFHYQQQSRTE